LNKPSTTRQPAHSVGFNGMDRCRVVLRDEMPERKACLVAETEASATGRHRARLSNPIQHDNPTHGIFTGITRFTGVGILTFY